MSDESEKPSAYRTLVFIDGFSYFLTIRQIASLLNNPIVNIAMPKTQSWWSIYTYIYSYHSECDIFLNIAKFFSFFVLFCFFFVALFFFLFVLFNVPITNVPPYPSDIVTMKNHKGEKKIPKLSTVTIKYMYHGVEKKQKIPFRSLWEFVRFRKKKLK